MDDRIVGEIADPPGNPATPVAASKPPRWPLPVWSIQLLPAVVLLLFGIWRLANADSIQGSGLVTWLVLIVAGGWTAIALAMLSLRAGRRWLVAKRAEWLLTAVSLVIGVVLLDIALNALGIIPTVEQQRAQSLGYAFGHFTRNRLVPKTVATEGRAPITINRRGFRGPEIAAHKVRGRARIVFLGGSHVFDYDGGGWPEMAGEELRRRGRDVEIINAGVPGHDTTDSLGKFLTDVWTLEPDIVVLCHAWNDVKHFVRLGPDSPYRELPPTEPQSWYRDWRIYPWGIDRVLSISAIYRNFRWGLGELFFNAEGRRRVTLDRATIRTLKISEWGPRQYGLNLALIASLSREIGAKLIVCKQSRLATVSGSGPVQAGAREYGIRMARLPHGELMRSFDAIYRVIDEAARKWGFTVVDMNAALTGRENYFVDGIHFSPEGSRAASKLAAAAIERVIAR